MTKKQIEEINTLRETMKELADAATVYRDMKPGRKMLRERLDNAIVRAQEIYHQALSL